MSRRKAILTLAGMAALPVGAGAAYLTVKKLTDPHILTYSEQSNTVLDAAWSPDGERVASAGWLDGGTVKIWNAATGKTLHTCRADHPGPGMVPLDVVWSADGRYVLAFVGWDREGTLTGGSRIVEMVQVWDATTGQRGRSIPVTEPITFNELGGAEQSLTLIRALNERYLAAVNGQDTGTVEIWEIATGAKIATLRAESQRPPSKVQDIVWAPDNETLVIGWTARDVTDQEFDPAIDIWNIATRSKIATLHPQSGYYLVPNNLAQTQASWAPDCGRLALLFHYSPTADTTRDVLEIWDTLAGKKAQTIQSIAPGGTRAWSPNGKYLLIGNALFDVETGARITTYMGEEGSSVTSVAWSPEGGRVALVDIVYNGHGFFTSRTSTLSVVDALSGRRIAKYGGGGTYGKLAWSPDGTRVMVVGTEVDIWKAE